jgi:hypothetical protein
MRGLQILLFVVVLHSTCPEVPICTGTYVLMQLFTAIIIENFSSTTRSSIISKEQLDSFVDVWVELDPGGAESRTGYLKEACDAQATMALDSHMRHAHDPTERCTEHFFHWQNALAAFLTCNSEI